MITIITFLLTLLGSVNWLLIGLLQYDFVAGIFGFQASIFSRIIYIIIGASSVFLVYKMIKCKGTIPIFTRRNKADTIKNIQKMNKHDKVLRENPVYDVEADREFMQNQENNLAHDENFNSAPNKSLFDEHFDER